MTEHQQMELCQEAMLEVIQEFKRRGIPTVEEGTLIAAAQILTRIDISQAILSLVYAGKVRLEFNSDGEMQIIAKK